MAAINKLVSSILPILVWITFLCLLTTEPPAAFADILEDRKASQCDVFRRHCKTCQDHEELCKIIENCENGGVNKSESRCNADNFQEIKTFCVACQNAKPECMNNATEKCTFSTFFPTPSFPGDCAGEKASCSKSGRPACCKNLVCAKESFGNDYYCQKGGCGRDGAKCTKSQDCCEEFSCIEQSGGESTCVVLTHEQQTAGGDSGSQGPETNCVPHRQTCKRSSNGEDNCCHEGGFACFCKKSPFIFMPKTCLCEFSREQITNNGTSSGGGKPV